MKNKIGFPFLAFLLSLNCFAQEEETIIMGVDETPSIVEAPAPAAPPAAITPPPAAVTAAPPAAPASPPPPALEAAPAEPVQATADPVLPETTPAEQAPVETAAETPAEAPAQAAETKPVEETQPESAPESEKYADVEIEDDEELPSPTENYELYEAKRLKRFNKSLEPRNSINLTVSPRAFTKTNFKAPTPTTMPEGRLPSQKQPSFRGIILGWDTHLVRKAGVLSFGLNGGLYSSAPADGYIGTMLGFITAGPSLTYQFNYMHNQWFVPVISMQYEAVYQNYGYEGGYNKKFHHVARGDAGMLFYMDFLDRMAAGDMKSSFGIKRTYILGTYSFAQDTNKPSLDLSERTWRVGLRFEY